MKFKIYIISILLTIVTSTTIFAQVPTIERDALIALYNSTNGTNWDVNINWNTTEPVDTWSGVTVANGHVTELVLAAINLDGTIPTQIGDLTSLTTLIFTGNDLLTGDLPPTISNLVNLNDLVLELCQFTGNLPSLPSTNSNVYIDGNRFNFSNLENEFANYQANTSIFNYAPQRKIDTEETIDITSGASYTMTMGLTSPNNRYQWFKNGTVIPGAIQKDYTISNATVADAGDYHCIAVNDIVTGLSLERNPIHITITADPCAVSQIERDALIALYNATNGTNWDDNTNWNTSAKVCDWNRVTVTDGHVTAITLQANNLVGNIPPEIGNLTELTILSLYTNQLTGAIPPEIGNLTKLNNLHLDTNQLTGIIPPQLGNLTSLTNLFLGNNQLTGIIPAELGNLTNLTDLRLDNNTLTGNIPSELGNLVNLSFFAIRNNEMSGTIPAELISLNNLTNIYLNNNQLSGDLPPISSLKSYIYISDNNFHFSNLENEFTTYQTNTAVLFQYSPQRKFDNIETINITLGNTYTLSTSLSSLNNNYQWYKDDVIITGATQKDYIITNALITDIGDYYCTVTNSTVTGLTLERNPIHIIDDGTACAIPQLEKDALIALYNATDGDFWTNNTNWNSTEPVCDWFGVTVSNGHVTELNLFKNQLNGTIPTEIGNLTNLTSLELMWNNLSGVIPVEIGNLTGLTNLKLATNKLTGGIPIQLGNLIDLVDIRLDHNNLGGTIPAELSNLINLTSLNLEHCLLTGSIPSQLGTLSNLIELRLSYNFLTGVIPAELGNLTSLEFLSLVSNRFSGSIPPELGNLSNLSYLGIGGSNLMTGTIPPELGNLSNLTTLGLGRMNLTGTIPAELGNLTNLTAFGVGFNSLSGSIPIELGNLINLKTLSLSNNNLSGIIPSELGNLINLQILSLRENQLSGSIPLELGNLNNLHSLDFSTNKFTGDLPALSFSSIIGISIDNNNFQFSNIENQFTNYQAGLNQFTYSPQNKIDTEETINIAAGGSYTMSTNLTSTNNSYQWFKDGVEIVGATQKDYTISNVTAADEGDYYCTATNSIVTGLTLERFPIHITVGGNTGGVSQIEKDALIALYNATDGPNWTNKTNWNTTEPVNTWHGVTVVDGKVTQVLLVNNSLVGTIPPEIGDLNNLTFLELSYSNQLTGSIPSEIGNLQNLTQLHFGSNALSGTIPSQLWNLQNLTYLELFGNNFAGSIPIGLGNLTNLTTLRLSGNQFSGAIPPELGNLTQLTELAIGRNQLTSIPSELGNLQNLTGLLLTDNLLSGSIPTFLGDLTELTNLSLGKNQFTGNIPPEIGNLTKLIILDLTENQLSGNIPAELGNLLELKGLSLFQNQLIGPIPTQVGALPNLTQVLIENNKLSGNLPPLSSSTIQNFRINNNDFVFLGMETEFTNYLQSSASAFTYSPQNKVDIEEIVDVAGGQSYTITTSLTSPNNTYKWFKDGVEIVGATENSYTIANATIADVGVYYFTATNSIITDLTLERFPITITVNGSDPCASQSERDALIAIYNATGGPNWINNTNWNTDVPVCDWQNVTVVDGKVTQLQLVGNNLIGTIPPEIGNLTNLKNLFLAFNKGLTGSIPSEIGNLTNLQELLIALNSNDGAIPTEIGNLQNLTNLNLGGNLSGTIPTQIGNLINLTQLTLVGNLTGNIPSEIGNLINLTQLTLGKNLTGNIPPEIGNLIQLTSLALDRNQLTSIPFELSNLSQLTWLNLNDNQLSGNIPSFLGNLTSLTNLSLGVNQFTGSIPIELGNLSNLTNLYLGDNQLSGTIPPQLGNLTNLTNFWLADNQLTGEIPAQIGALPNLRQLIVDNNQLSGSLPVIGSTTLQSIFIENNNFIFTGLENQFSTYLSLASNGFLFSPQSNIDIEETIDIATGGSYTMSISLTNPNNSYQWYKDDIEIVGATSKEFTIANATALDVGDYVCKVTNINVPDLTLERYPVHITIDGSSCNISQEEKAALIALYNATDGANWTDNTNWLTDTPVCEWFGVDTILGRSLLLSNNNLVGTLPPELGNLSSFAALGFTSNQSLTGSIPTELTNISNLLYLVVNGNQLSGTVPSGFKDMPNLVGLFIEFNNFQFSDFENDFVALQTNLQSFTYIPQENIDTEETVSISEGGTYTMSMGLTSTNNSYQWYKDGIAIPGATLKDYTINDATLADAGDYYATATNSIVTDLTLERFPIHLSVIICDENAGIISTGSTQNCTNTPTSFSINTLPPGITDKSYVWTFYDLDNTTVLGTSTLENPEFTYNIIGSYLVTLEITHSTGCITSSNNITVEDCVMPPGDCDTCNSFKPMPGKKYVISGWVKENREILCSPGTINAVTPTTDLQLEVNFALNGNSAYVDIEQSTDQITWTSSTGDNSSPRIITPITSFGKIYVRLNSEYCEEYSEVVSIDFTPSFLIIEGPSIASILNPVEYLFLIGSAGTNATATWSIDFGDGSAPQTGTGRAVTLSHQYTQTGNKTITFNVIDENGFPAQTTFDVTVVDEIPLTLDFENGELRGQPNSEIFIRTIVQSQDTSNPNQVIVIVFGDGGSDLLLEALNGNGTTDVSFIMPASGIVDFSASFIPSSQSLDPNTNLANVKVAKTLSGLNNFDVIQFTLDDDTPNFPF